jgi:hypothetical protein
MSRDPSTTTRIHRDTRLANSYAYIAQFATGVIKVGTTMHPRTRLRHHASVAVVHGGALDRFWLSPLHGNALATERALIDFAHSLGGTVAVGREYFSGVEFDQLVGYASSLRMERIPRCGPRAPSLTTVDGFERLLFTLDEVAAMTGFKLRTIEDAARAGRIDVVRLTRTPQMTRDQIAALSEADLGPRTIPV